MQNQDSNRPQSNPQTIRVLLADDHPIVMTGFAMTLAAEGMEVVGQAKTPTEAVQQFFATQADVIVLDIRFGAEMTGLDAAKQILEKQAEAQIVFLSQFDQDALIKETYRLGAKAFVTKDCDPADLAIAVRRAAQGELYFMPSIAERLANLSVRGDTSPQTVLDERSLAIFKLMAEGLTNVEIAEKLDLSQKTISNISQSVKEKLGVHRPALITKLAVKYGLIEP
ncbi:response regulator transcription factor [Undibacterium baiyunense]|uniref:Response regulator transcription factor n=1 Tax=Undibacterium baiyunense TaxID=2828731 RepID=A0A941DDN9_9BURK|nr:response regulator transcription factor [Undibacterium baiyunense]MBR7746819.1 response regulator transcription factor [Undibacterium baiyunense]